MNIKITYNWLLEYLDTDADPYEIQKYLSLCGPGIERIDKVGDDYVFDIEVTSNRIDMASVFGIAQEATATLPQFGKKATLKFNPLSEYTFKKLQAEPSHKKQLHVTITNADLCPRFTAMVVSNVGIKPAPDIIRERLQMCDIKSINNVVDISNYIMLSLGQPTHMFDYDKIGKNTMILRESKKGEKLITLDGKEIILPGGDTVIEDGDGKLIDLCGIMGGENSEITKDTENVVFFVQTYNKRKIRKTSMTTGQRSVAATYFEKGLDTERVEPAFVYGLELLMKHSDGMPASQLYDIYPHPYKPKHIAISMADIERVIGVSLEKDRVTAILKNLGFGVDTKQDHFDIIVPSYRNDDVDMKADIVEEVARIYGYHNLPNNLQHTVYIPQPTHLTRLLQTQSKLKYFLKHGGLNEVFNYSMTSEKLLRSLDLDPSLELKVANTISEEIEYMRRSLKPSLIKNIADNQGKRDALRFFEIARVYHKREGDLPEELNRLGIVTNTDFYDLKGIVEAVFKELNMTDVTFEPFDSPLFYPKVQAKIVVNGTYIGNIGQLKKSYQDKLEIKHPVFVAELSMDILADSAKIVTSYTPPNSFATVYMQWPITVSDKMPFADFKKKALERSALLQQLEVVNIEGNKILVKFAFTSPEKNITEEEAKQELEKLKK